MKFVQRQRGRNVWGAVVLNSRLVAGVSARLVIATACTVERMIVSLVSVYAVAAVCM